MSGVPAAAREILDRGAICYLAAPSPRGPHVTPLVFVLEGDRVWVTTSRGTVKARSWRRKALAGGLVSVGDRAVAFGGRVALYDALDPFTWPASLFRAPAVMRASARFTAKNARFFAGYARDAYRIPLSWTPPGRVIASVDLDRGAVLDVSSGRVREAWGDRGARPTGHGGFRRPRGEDGVEERLPADLRDLAEGPGAGVLGVEVPEDQAPVVIPVRWARADGRYFAATPTAFLALAGPDAGVRAALVSDRASAWRASRMRGVLLRGPGEVYVLGDVTDGARSLRERAESTGSLPDDASVVVIRPERAVWWRGWASGSVTSG
jgi:hypothetical protein